MREGLSRAAERAFSWRWLWSLLAVLAIATLTGPLAAETLDAAADARDAADAGDEDAAVDVPDASVERSELASLLAFLDGRLGPLRSAELFRVDLRSDEAVAQRLAEINGELTAVRRDLKRAALPDLRGDADAGDAGVQVLDQWLLETPAHESLALLLRVRRLELRRQILSLPRDRRQALLAAEEQALRAEAARLEKEDAEAQARRAEEERLKALAAAQEARSVAARRLAEARAQVEAVRGEQLRERGRLAERRHALKTKEQAYADTATELEAQARAVQDGSPEADALYDKLVALLVNLRASANALLGDLERPAREARPPSSTGLDDIVDAELRPLRDQLVASFAQLDRDATQLEVEDREMTWTALRAVMTTEPRVNDRRIALLEKVSSAKRASVLGFGEEGFAQGAREISRFRLELRWLRLTWLETGRDFLVGLRRPAAVARMSLQVLSWLGILWLTVTVRRRHPLWLRWLRSATARSIRRPSVVRTVQRITEVLDAIGSELATLGGVLLLLLIPSLDLERGPLSILFLLILGYWSYRLALTVTHRGLAWLADRSDAPATSDLGERILRSVRLVGRAAFAITLLLASSAAVVGKGYLHALVVRFAWTLGVTLAMVLVRRWRNDIADAYLRVRPSGALSRLVERTRQRWIGFFVVVIAFGYVLAATLARAVRRFILGFEHSRKALAYLFRRRLEKQQVEQAEPTEEASLDAALLEFFSERAVADGTPSIDRYPGLDDFVERLERFDRGEREGATLVVGRTGYGKSSWLGAADRRAKGRLETSRISLSERATSSGSMTTSLARALDVSASTPDALIERLSAGPRRLILVDDAQLLFLRGVGTLDGWRTFAKILEHTSHRVLWTVAFAHYAWEFLAWLLKGDHVFRTTVSLSPWTEAEITELLKTRTEASKLAIAYDDLLVDDPRTDASAQILTTARDYNRLIWDYAEGSPRVALHVWGRSLVPDGKDRARVRLFANADTAALEALSESAKFVLAAIVWHERLSLDEALRVTLLPRMACEDAFERFLERGIAKATGDYLVITPRWWPVVIRYLRRKHLIET